MIFVTVGTQLGFDRLVATVDAWVGAAPGRQAFAQIGPGAYLPRNMEYSAFVDPEACRRLMERSEAIVAHAGMGTILGALELGRPLLVMPRKASLGEHRNDHQLATARRLAELGRINVAADEHELTAALNQTAMSSGPDRIGPYASDRLINALSSFIAA